MFKNVVLLLAAILFLPVLFLACQLADEEIPEPQETIIARIGDKTISQNEFIRRAEYTIRPAYAKGDNYIHRKIILNSLVAEKLLALEAENDPYLAENEEFQDYLAGRKEQAMRQWFYHQAAFEKSTADTNEIKTVFSTAGRTYRVAWFSLQDSSAAAEVQKQLTAQVSFDSVYAQLSGNNEKVPEREISLNSAEHDAVLNVLYAQKPDKNDVIGPIEFEKNRFTVLKVMAWMERAAVSNADAQQRWEDGKTWLQERKAAKTWDGVVSEIMRGKKIEFMPYTFRALVNVVGPYYLRMNEQKKEALNSALWSEAKNEVLLENLGGQVDNLQNQPLFRVAGEIWTVADFEREMRRRPLVFRKRRIPKGEFAEQFKLAIVDMVRDRFVTQEAYKRGYDKAPIVQRNFNMWRDNLAALYAQNRFLQEKGKLAEYAQNHLDVIKTNLDPLIDSLQTKYAPKIEINTDAFEQIKLTRIDMFVTQRNAPFPIVVPNFPVLTTDDRLDYGRKAQSQERK